MAPVRGSDATIARYLQGQMSAREAREVAAWMEADPINRARVDALRAIWSVTPMEPTPRADAMWARLRRRMSGGVTSPRVHRIDTALRRRWGTQIAVAASLMIVAGAAVVFSVARRRVSVPAPVAPSHEYATGRGERATAHLADGSVVTLAAGSRVRIPADFGATKRELVLEGEAIFQVVHDAAQPFRVRAGRALVEDAGTRFDVRAYGDEPTVAVAVADGSVSMRRVRAVGDSSAYVPTDSERVRLRRGQLAELAPDGRVTSASGVHLQRYFGWADGHLVFVKAPLPDVLRTIGRWYDLDIRVPDPVLAARLVSAEFSTQAPGDMLDALAAAVDARFTRDGRIVTLTRRP
jgi:transmembrane sensor